MRLIKSILPIFAVLLACASLAFADDVPTVVDPTLIEQNENLGATTINLSAILGHWLNITGNNLYSDLGMTTPPSGLKTSQYWQFQNILNDTGTTITTITLDMYGTPNAGKPTQITHFYCGGTVATDFTTCSVSPTSIQGPAVQVPIIATWTLSGGTVGPGERFALNLTNDDISFTADYRIGIPTPEPSSLLLLGSGCSALFGMLRRRLRVL